MKKATISGVILTKNEAANIAAAIKSIEFVDQIVVVDTGSDDDTIEIARKAGAEVYSIAFEGFGVSKNKAINYCTGEWVLSIDADERVSKELAQSILLRVANANNVAGFKLCRLSNFLGKPIRHSGWFPDYVLRLFRNGSGKFNEVLVHEAIEVSGNVETLPELLYHNSYVSLGQYMDKLNFYTSLNASQLFKSGKKFSLLDLIIHPPSTFMKMYIAKLGFLDGFHGLALAELSSFHVFLKYLKLWELWRNEKSRTN